MTHPDRRARCDVCGRPSTGARQRWAREYLLGLIPVRTWLGRWRYHCNLHRETV